MGAILPLEQLSLSNTTYNAATKISARALNPIMKHTNLSEWAIKNQVLVLYFLFVTLAAGILAYTQLPQKEDPDFTFKVMTIKATWPGATAHEMELQVTDTLERSLQETPWLDNVSSYSKPGESTIFVTLKDEMPPAELEHAWMTVRKHLADMRDTLPEGVNGPFIDDEYGTTYSAIYAFTADQPNYAALEHEADLARQSLLQLSTVSKVELIGTQPEKVYIEFSAAKLATLGIAPMQIAAAIKSHSTLESAGEIVTQDDTTRIRLSSPLVNLAALQNLTITARGKTHQLGDLSQITQGTENPARFKMRYRGQNAIGLAVAAQPNGDVIEFGHGLETTLAHVRSHLPQGMHLHQISDQPKVVKQSISTFMKALSEALLIVLAISFLSLGWRAGLVVALSIPIVLAGTFLLMKVFGIDLQRVSIGALIIAIGLLVDDAMIAVEMMKVKLEQGWSRASAAVFAYRSTAFPMLTGTLITAAAFLPVGLAKSSAGEYTFSICAVVTIALLVSWLVAVVFTPFIGFHLLSEHADQETPQYRSRFYAGFRNVVIACLHWRKSVILATLAAFMLALIGFSKVEQQFFPPSERPELLLDIWLPESANFALTEMVVDEVEKLLKDDAAVAQYTSYVGGSSPRFYLPLDLQPPTINYAQIVIEAHDIKAREEVLKRIRSTIDKEYPDSGVRISRLENGPPVGYPIQFWIMGDDTERLRAIASDVLAVVKANPNTKNASQDSDEPLKSLRVEIDEDAARTLGVNTNGLARHLQATLSGYQVTTLREGGQQIGVILRSVESERTAPNILSRLSVISENGQTVPLARFAKIESNTEAGILWRMNRQPIVTVRADIPDDIQAPDVSQTIDQKLADIRAKLPPGYQIKVAGAMADSDKATDSIVAVLPLTGFLILTLLMLQLRRFSEVALVLLTAPLGVIGVAAVLLAFHVPFGFVAMLGMISLAGMIMRNSVILVDQIEQDMALGLSRHDAIIDSTVRRARPILLTAAAAILAMIPLTGSVFWGPMAIVIMGGLLVATLLTLLALPAMYAAWFRVSPEK
ncbi:Multidrug resistance protein MdtC [Ferriphaselus amnicola]|uniref:Multidrug resistance protein MdtC n=2 Tax=Ferriphaselus amnicola TaxID=1188319 RepID=A0A2Z6GA13_9PROT|nr:Multidrug resistance protein MdtC [Ferriphaselus amnicola]